jgi:hypothetical protein
LWFWTHFYLIKDLRLKWRNPVLILTIVNGDFLYLLIYKIVFLSCCSWCIALSWLLYHQAWVLLSRFFLVSSFLTWPVPNDRTNFIFWCVWHFAKLAKVYLSLKKILGLLYACRLYVYSVVHFLIGLQPRLGSRLGKEGSYKQSLIHSGGNSLLPVGGQSLLNFRQNFQISDKPPICTRKGCF